MEFDQRILFFLTLFIKTSVRQMNSLKILQFAEGFGPSHMLFNYRLAKSLTSSSSNHSITIITVEHFHNLSNSAKHVPAGVHEYIVPSSLDEKSMKLATKSVQGAAYQEESILSLVAATAFFEWSETAACSKLLGSEELMSMARDGSFDLVLAPVFEICPLFIAHEIGVPILWHSAFSAVIDGTALSMQIPSLPSYVPNAMAYSGDTMSFFQRVRNVILHWMNSATAYVLAMLHNRVYNKYFPKVSRPSLWNLVSNIDMLLMNGEQWLEFPRPLIRGVNYLGEIGNTRRRLDASNISLDQEWEDIVNSGSKGLILFSLGSVVNTTRMPIEMQVRQKFTDFILFSRCK